jgi:hypothetical protein
VKQVCERRARGIARLLRAHTGETGVVVHGWFPPGRIFGPTEWMDVPVNIDGGDGDVVSQTGPRTIWLPAGPGCNRLRVGVSVSGERLSPETHETAVDLRIGEAALFVFATPRPSFSGRFAKPVWCAPVLIRQLGPT